MTSSNTPRNAAGDSMSTLANGPAPESHEPISPYYPILSAPVEKDEIGRLGNYRVLRLLGSGGMGMVFHAVDMRLGRPVALKVMKPDSRSKELTGERFMREAKGMAAIKHDNLITIYDIGQEGGTYFIAMELLLGESLEAHAERITRWEVSEIIRVGLELAGGLAAIHERGLIHRDIKPANIWLEEPHGRVKILDFGLVRAAKDDAALTGTGVIMGTPAFMAPEQIRGKMADVRSDLYSFGCVLYRLCTGRLPHDGDNSMAQLAAAVADDPADPRTLNPSLPAPLSELVMQLLAKDAARRPASAHEVVERLGKIQASLTARNTKNPTARVKALDSSAVHAAVIAKKPTFLERHWGKLLLGGMAAALALVLVAVVVVGAVVLVLLPAPRPGLLPPKRDDKFDAKVVGGPIVAVPDKNRIYLQTIVPIDKAEFDPEKKKKDDKGPKDGFEFKKGGFDFRTVSLDGKAMPRSFLMHPVPPHDPSPAMRLYQLDGQYRLVQGAVTQNDSGERKGGGWSPMIFSIYLDDEPQPKWQSRPVRTQADRQEFSVSVQGAKTMKLQVTADGEIKECHGVWVDPYLVK